MREPAEDVDRDHSQDQPGHGSLESLLAGRPGGSHRGGAPQLHHHQAVEGEDEEGGPGEAQGEGVEGEDGVLVDDVRQAGVLRPQAGPDDVTAGAATAAHSPREEEDGQHQHQREQPGGQGHQAGHQRRPQSGGEDEESQIFLEMKVTWGR